MNDASPADAKRTLRRRFDAYRRQLGDDDYARLSTLIVGRMKALPELRDARTIAGYWPLTEKHEVDVRPLLVDLHRRGTRVVLPMVTSFGAAGQAHPRMKYFRFEGADRLRSNRWGIHEPTSEVCVPREEIDAMVVPALGAGRNGHRIGHGLGYYDEYLAALPALRLCPVYAACLVDHVPLESHDVPMSILITEREVVRLEPDR